MLKFLSVTIVACGISTPRAVALEPLWTYQSPLGIVDSTPAVADLDHDGMQEVILTTTGGSVIVIDHQGKQIWMRGVQIPISIPPTVVDLMAGSELEILVLNQAGSLYCLSGRSGDVLWRYDLPGTIEWGATSIVAVDLDHDGSREIVVGDQAGHVMGISSRGELLWKYDGNQGATYSPSIGILNNESNPSILISGAKSPLLCLDSKGNQRWQVAGAGKGASPILADINGDGQNEILTARDNNVFAVSGKGTVLWTYPMRKELDGSLAAADANEDGILEIYAIDLAGHMAAIGPDGKGLWTANVHQRVRRSPAIGDIDGDGKLEVVVAGYSGELYLYTAEGDLKDTLPLSATTNSAPILADFEGDGMPTLVLAPGDGSVVAYRWPEAKAGAKVLWPQYRFNAARQGLMAVGQIRSPVRITELDVGNLYVGPNTIQLVLENPQQSRLKTTVTVDLGQSRVRRHHFDSQQPTQTFQANYLLDGVMPTTLRIDCEVYDGKHLLARRSRTAYVIPFVKELADLDDTLRRSRKIATILPDAYEHLGRIDDMISRLAKFRNQAEVSGTLDDTARRTLRDSLRTQLASFWRLHRLLTTAKTAHARGQWPLRLSAANPWAPLGGLDEIVEGRLQSADLKVQSFSGETESAALNLFHLGTKAITARVEIDDFIRKDASGESSQGKSVLACDVVKLHEVLEVPTQSLDRVADALPRMNTAQVITLPPWNVRQLWLNLNTKNLTPGDWTTTVRIRTLGLDSQEFIAPLSLTVWEAALPPVQPLRHCNWGYVHNSRHQHYEAQALEDRIAHGNNVFVSTFAPKATYDKQGHLQGDIDFSQHDVFVNRYSPHGLILFHAGGLTGPGGLESEAFRQAYHTWMRAWVSHLKAMGVDYDQYAMYPVDEPGLRDGLVERYLRYARLTREADPKVQMYTDPVMRITSEELTRMSPFVDIWCPNRIGFLLQVGADKLQIMKQSGAQMWTYECEGNAKHQSPLGYYRGQSWLAWKHGLTGIGFWSYCTSSADPWFKPQATQDYLLTYQGMEVVGSKRWEAVRDGIEDYSMLSVLEDALNSTIEQAKVQGESAVMAKAMEQARSLLGKRAAAIAKFCNQETTPGKSGMPGMREQADFQWAEIQTLRSELAEAIGWLKE